MINDKSIFQEESFSNGCTGESGSRIRPCCYRYLFTYMKIKQNQNFNKDNIEGQPMYTRLSQFY
jgi:hypothetical protein